MPAPATHQHTDTHNDDTDREQLAQISQMFHAPVLLPVISKERFASLTGFPPGVIDGWVNRGYLPTTRFGKWSGINLIALSRQVEQQR